MQSHASENWADVAVVGAGIVGLAHAWEAARRGLKVVVFERNRKALGASIRNFGMILPIGMAAGKMHERALRSRERWIDFIRATGIWHRAEGILIPAYRDDEERAMQEFVEWGTQHGYKANWIAAKDALVKNPINPKGLRGALYSSLEMQIDPREAIPALAAFLAQKFDVQFVFDAAVTRINLPEVEAGGRLWQVERLAVCCGSDFQLLYPQLLNRQKMRVCKLQMMRTKPQPATWQLGPYLATGLSLPHYASFAACPAVQDIRNRIQNDLPALVRWGIHLLVAQQKDGSLVIGDSHVYGDENDPFDAEEIYQLILEQLSNYIQPPALSIAFRWHGEYAKTENGEPLVLAPSPDIRIITGMGGGGMTTGFALAEDVFQAWC